MKAIKDLNLWIELDLTKDEAQNDYNAKQLTRLFKKLGNSVEIRYNKHSGKYDQMLQGGTFTELADNGQWFNLDGLIGPLYPEHCNEIDRLAAQCLVDAILEEGCMVSVWDSEEWTLEYSDSRQDILKAMATSDLDNLAVWTQNQGNPLEHQGTFGLFYGEAPAYEPQQLVYDWSFGEETQGKMDKIANRMEALINERK